MSIIEFPDKRPWMKPQENFEDDAMNFAVSSPYGWELVKPKQKGAVLLSRFTVGQRV